MTKAATELFAVSNGDLMGAVRQAPRTGELEFTYDEDWRRATGAFPLSLTMPLQQVTYADGSIRLVLQGWIPDRRETLQRLAEEHHIAPGNPFAVLSVVGEDCPGAVQFVRPERLKGLQGAGQGEVVWLTEAELALRLRLLKTPGAPDRLHGDRGRFSLPGQMPKLALAAEHDPRTGVLRWGVPDGAYPTTHILKPPLGDDVRYLVAELLSLQLARAVGLPAAEVSVARAEDHCALAVTRFDRVHTSSGWLRAHQEDFCQALGWSPDLKFEETGGPGTAEIIECLRTHSAAPDVDIGRFLCALALSWIILNTDAHARNYSVLIGAGGGARLAPLYDVMSVLGIAQPQDVHTLKLTMQVGGVYNAEKIRREQWRALAISLGLHPADVEALIADFAVTVAEQMATVAATARQQSGLPIHDIDQLEDRIVKRAARCARLFGVKP